MFFSKTTVGFYDTAIHGDSIPNDAVEISVGEHTALLAGQAEGKIIVADCNGAPKLVDPAEPTDADKIKTQIAELEAQITPRRMREAVLGTDNGWLSILDKQIAILRAKL